MPIELRLADARVRVLTLDDLDPAGRRVLVRVDFNVPLADRRVADDTRLRAAVPTITELLDRGAALVLMSHLGRPKGIDQAKRMRPVAEALAALIERPVQALDVVTGPAAETAVADLRPGDVVLLENLRFDPGEKADDPGFAADLARLGECYVNDAFGTAHRAAASVVGVTHHLPSYAGRLMARELETLGSALEAPRRPFVVILGGAKIGDKIGVIDALLPKSDAILVGGGMANTFLAADGIPMGDSLVEEERLAEARRIRAAAGERLVVPVDAVIADAFSESASARVIAVADGVPEGWRVLDIGPASVAAFAVHLRPARTVFWNGPMGVFEMAPFACGTFDVARVLAAMTNALTIVGGGDSAAAVRAAGLVEAMGWVSTGGGASLELLEGKQLPAVAALAIH